MNTYLTIMVTILVLTQIIRLIQNAMQLGHLTNKKYNQDVVQAWNKLEKAIDRLNEKESE